MLKSIIQKNSYLREKNNDSFNESLNALVGN